MAPGSVVIVSLTTGIRTEEARALRWDHVDLDGDPCARTPVPPGIAVWRSVRLHGDTRTEKFRRTLAMPQRAIRRYASALLSRVSSLRGAVLPVTDGTGLG